MERTFSVETRPTRTPAERQEYGDAIVTIHADPKDHPQPDGSVHVSMGFPVLTVSGWVGEPEKFAAHVAALLSPTQSQPTPEGREERS